MSPTEFTEIKQKIESSPILNDQEKREWLYLLPRMNEEQMGELERILSVKLPPAQKSPAASVPPPALPPLREARDRGISPHQVFSAAQKHPIVPPLKPPRPQPFSSGIRREKSGPADPTAVPREAEKAAWSPELNQLALLSVSALRQSSSPGAFFTEVRSTIKNLLAGNLARSEQIAKAFDQSPLQKAYLDSGWKIMENAGGAELTQKELEAMTDFRSSLRKILQ